jgi:hypothetical protein
LSGNIHPAKIVNGVMIPPDYCLSTVARLSKGRPNIAADVHAAMQSIAQDAGMQYCYPAESLHLTLLGCSPRLPSAALFSSERRARIRDVCRQVIPGSGPVDVHLRGLGIAGNQIFIQGFSPDDRWALLRARLEEALLAAGEKPMSYPSKRPIHINVIRITDARTEYMHALLKAVEDRRSLDYGTISIQCVDYVLADFLLSRAESETIDEFRL